MKKLFYILLLLLFACSDSNNPLSDADDTGVVGASWVFVANEGNFGSSNGSVSMINEYGDVITTVDLGETVQSLEVYNNKLIVLINGNSEMKIFDITESGLSMPGITVDLNGSGPRELVVVDNKIYFTNWNSQDVKVFNLFNYAFEDAIAMPGLPEDIIFDGEFLWVAINMNADWSAASEVVQIDLSSKSVIAAVDVGLGPQDLEVVNNEVFVSRTFYDESWAPNHGMAKFSNSYENDVVAVNYGAGVACSGKIIKLNNDIYRTLSEDQSAGGIAALDDELNFIDGSKIGTFEQSYIYHAEFIDGVIWFALTDYAHYNIVKAVDFSGNELGSYQVGVSPRDFAKWTAGLE